MSATSYPSPLREEPLAIELHNTLYAVAGASLDGLVPDAPSPKNPSARP